MERTLEEPSVDIAASLGDNAGHAIEDEHRDETYETRRAEIARRAAGPRKTPRHIEYLDVETQTWAIAKQALEEIWADAAAPAIVEASARLGLPTASIPQLTQVTQRLAPRTGFEFRAVPGLVPVKQFFGSLADGVFLSTQYVRHHASPLYTPEPDIIHEVIGHATALADPHLSLLHRAAGAAILRLETETAIQFVADVFWFSAEFGVLFGDDRPKAYGAGILSSVGEMHHVPSAQVRPLNIVEMGTLSYDIAQFQPVLFAGESLAHVLDVVGEFFAEASDDSVARLLAK